MISFIGLIGRKDNYCRESIKYNIEGLSSLKTLQLITITDKVYFSIKNLPSLTNLSFFSKSFYCKIDENIERRLLNQVPHIQELHLSGNLCYFNLDNLVNLRVLSLSGYIEKNFNLELFKNLCNKLEDITICLSKIDEKTLFKLFDGYNFPYLADFTIKYLNMKRLTKKFIDLLPNPRGLNITDCGIQVIEHDSFSNMQQLTSLNLSYNRIEFIEKNAFSKLKNLQKLDLSDNELTDFDPKFICLSEPVEVKIENNRLRNYLFSM